jgi:anti-sigma regulatory factor (Ser/Thr protein kinase)
MAKDNNYSKIISTVTRDTVEHPSDLTRVYRERFGVSRVTANKYIQRLESEGWLARSGPSTRPVFSPGYRRRVSHLYNIVGLDEQTPWDKDFEPYFSFKPNIRSIVQHGFTEMLNNAIDHSEGKRVFCFLALTNNQIFLAISDNGVGIFKKISDALNLPDQRQSLLELSKGKFTTDPSRHSGEGIFFTSRMFDSFEIKANDLKYTHYESDPKDFLEDDSEEGILAGTTVYMVVNKESGRTTAEIYDKFTSAPDDFTFSKTVIPLQLARYGGEQLVSRSQAKRLIARFDQFRTVILDFSGITEIGQAFADEVFRVYTNAHPEIEIVPKNMANDVENMYLRVRQTMPATKLES